MGKAIRQQNAERRLRHCRWEHETRGDINALLYGIVAALVFVLIWVYANAN